MKWQLIFGVVAIIAYAPASFAHSNEDSSSSSDSSDSKESKKHHRVPVKVISLDVLSYNNAYLRNDYSICVNKVNEFYNALAFNFTLLKDLPLDTKVAVKVYQSSSLDGTYTVIGQPCSFYLSDKNCMFHRHLPPQLIKDTQTSKVLLKGYYSSKDYGFYKFYKLLSKEELKHSFYKVEYSYNYACNDEPIISLAYRFQSLPKKHKRLLML